MLRITCSVDDVHSMDTGFKQAIERLKEADIGQTNKDNIERFLISCRHKGLKKSTITHPTKYAKRFIEEIGN